MKQDAIKEAIAIYQDIMIESQAQIRAAQTVIENMQKRYKKATEAKEKLAGDLLKEHQAKMKK